MTGNMLNEKSVTLMPVDFATWLEILETWLHADTIKQLAHLNRFSYLICLFGIFHLYLTKGRSIFDYNVIQP